MNTNALRLFLHIMQRGSLVAAATELNMSPSAASCLLMGLERETGLVLFSRNGKRLHPTAEGKQYFSECYRVLVAVDDLPRVARRLASGTKERLRLLSNPRFAATLMNPAIGRLLRSNPKIEIDLQIVVRYEVELTSSERSFDVGITALPLKHASVHTEPLLDMPATAIMRRDHPLARRAFVRLPELAGQPLVATPLGSSLLRQEVESMFAAEGLEFRPQLTVSQVDIACHIVLQAGAIMISDPLIPLTLNAEAYAVVPLRPVRVLHVGIVTPALNPDSRLTTLFKLCLREEAKFIEERLTHRFGNLNAPRNREASRRTVKPRDRALSSKS
jgi:DNA-binding transcriptional LysR family regulator